MTDSIASDEVLRLSDGRRMAYAQYGDPSGAPILFCQGFGDSRLTHPDVALTASLGVPLIVPDRPGIGGSDPSGARVQADLVPDVRSLLDGLALDRVAVFGWSGGGPLALCLGALAPDRATRIGIASGFAPFDLPQVVASAPKEMRQAAGLLRRLPWLARVFLANVSRDFRRDPAKAFERQSGAHMHDADRAALADPAVKAAFLAGAAEAVRQGNRGLAADMVRLFGRPWGARPADVRVPVDLWYGDGDTLVPPAMGRWLAAAIPGARLTVYPGEGHLLRRRLRRTGRRRLRRPLRSRPSSSPPSSPSA